MNCRIYQIKETGILRGDNIHHFDNIDALVKQCADELTQGKLVAFPSETVYGLGADGLNATAVEKIFTVKGRPKSDPCILHVYNGEDALKLLDIDEEQMKVFLLLTEVFWPGPLSIVSKASSIVPAVTMGGGSEVAVRSPKGELIRQLLKEFQRPIAGPSANKFGRISPTEPHHVRDAFLLDDISIIDDGTYSEVGIESTVVRMSRTEQGYITLTILRRGGITASALRECVGANVIVEYDNKEIEDVMLGKISGRAVMVEGQGIKSVMEEIDEASRAYDDAAKDSDLRVPSPGTCITHYAPLRTCLMIRLVFVDSLKGKRPEPSNLLPNINSCLLINLNRGYDITWSKNEMINLKTSISNDNDDDMLMSQCFKVLHEAEAKAESIGSKAILIPILDQKDYDERTFAVYDRLYRACSGKVCNLLVERGEKTGLIQPLYLYI